uniref:Caerulein-2.1/2.1Y4 n=1 Tax=Ranoidea citropa TaxID=94770 RepID=CAE21_RANCI|nr:RecName: Full=Caerulein-2.1/2.1Y4 [Ranoidea citropa]
QQDYTGAHMDF